MRVVHLSDLHMSQAESRDQCDIIDALIRDLEAASAEVPVDVVAFTGDLAFAGSDEEFRLAQAVLLDRVEQCLGVDRSRIVLLPGNHDVNRAAVDPILEAGLTSLLTDRTAVNKLLESDEQRQQALRRLEQWESFRTEYYAGVESVKPAGPLSFVHYIETEDGLLGVATLNTAWRAQGGDEDRGRLLIGEAQLRPALDAISECALQVAALHHPLDWLHPFDADTTRSEFEGRQLLILSGHEHNADPGASMSARGQCVHDRGGCLYETHEYRNSYSRVDALPREGNITVTVRDWYAERPPRGEFDRATRLGGDGVVGLSLTAATGDKHPAYSVVMDSLANLAFDRSVLLDPPAEDISIRLSDVLVPPNLSSVPHRQALGSATFTENASTFAVSEPLELLADQNVVIVSGESVDDGVTTTVLWLLSLYYEKAGALLPVYLENAKQLGTQRSDRAIRRAAADIGYTSAGTALPPLLLAIDDADDPYRHRAERLARYIADNPQNRYVVAAHGDALARLGAAFEARDIPTAHLYVWPFGQREVRALVTRASGEDDQALVQRVSSLLMSNRLPRNPFIIAALVAVLRSETDFKAINESSVLAAYIRYVLGATDITDPAELGLDFRRREHLLGCLAEELLEKPGFRMTRLEAERYVANYYAEQSYTRSPSAVLQDLIDRRVLIQVDDHVGFRQAAFLYLCAGNHMTEIDHKAFKARMLEDPVRYAPIIRHAAGLGRNDEELLQRVTAVLETVLEGVTEVIEPSAFDELFENRERRAATLENLGQQLSALDAPPATPDDGDEAADRVHDLVLAQRDDEPPAAELSPLEVLGEAVELAGQVLKSSEFVRNDPLKLQSAKLVVAGQAVIGAATAGRENKTHEFRDQVLELVRALEEQGVPVPAADDVDFWLRVLIVALIVIGAVATLAAPHLRAVIKELKQDQELMAAPGRALLVTMVAIALELEDAADDLIALYERFPNYPYLRELVRDVAVARYRTTKDDRESKKLLSFLVDLYAGVDGDKNRVREELSKARLRALGQSAELLELGDAGPLDPVGDQAKSSS
jgi:hypothetical protein